jgi:hypothetical protein
VPLGPLWGLWPVECPQVDWQSSPQPVAPRRHAREGPQLDPARSLRNAGRLTALPGVVGVGIAFPGSFRAVFGHSRFAGWPFGSHSQHRLKRILHTRAASGLSHRFQARRKRAGYCAPNLPWTAFGERLGRAASAVSTCLGHPAPRNSFFRPCNCGRRDCAE